MATEMRLYRVKAYTLSPEPEFSEETTDLDVVEAEVHRASKMGFDWVYVEVKQDGEWIEACFNGIHTVVPDYKQWIEDERGQS